jgi:hypothetical protein
MNSPRAQNGISFSENTLNNLKLKTPEGRWISANATKRGKFIEMGKCDGLRGKCGWIMGNVIRHKNKMEQIRVENNINGK